MNKILVGKEKNKEMISFQASSKETLFQLEPYQKARLILLGDHTTQHLLFELKEHSELEVFHATKESSDTLTIRLLGEGATINYRYHTLSTTSKTLQVTLEHLASNTNGIIETVGFHEGKESLQFFVNTIIPRTSISCRSKQDNRILTREQNTSLICPNLFIDTDDVEAEHAAYLGTFSKDALFYLASRGISQKMREQLLMENLLLGGFSLTEEERRCIKYLFFPEGGETNES